MTLEQNQHGTFCIKGVETTKAEKAGGKNGFPRWTKAGWRKKQQEKLDRERGGKKN